MAKTDWMCIHCGHILGDVLGGDLHIKDGIGIQTRGVNLKITCPKCGAEKIWYPADPIVRAIYQLVDAVVTVSAKRMVEVAGQQLMEEMRGSDK